MPAKRRASKRRFDVSAEIEAWASTFESGVTFDGELECVGIPCATGRPTQDEIRTAWHRLGARFTAERGRETALAKPVWALSQFGETGHAS